MPERALPPPASLAAHDDPLIRAFEQARSLLTNTPHSLREKKPTYERGLNIDHINQLAKHACVAGVPVFEDEHIIEEGREIRRVLHVNHPRGDQRVSLVRWERHAFAGLAAPHEIDYAIGLIERWMEARLLQLGPADPGAPPDASISEDGASVNWFGAKHTFSTRQARIVKWLWGEWKAGRAGLQLNTIAERLEADPGTFRMAATFRSHKHGRHPAFGTMIQQIRTGVYGLVRPNHG